MNTTKRLKVLAAWLRGHVSDWDERYGALERAINQSQVETMYQIADYLEEILAMSDEEINEEASKQNERKKEIKIK